jgi:hypothetical protein
MKFITRSTVTFVFLLGLAMPLRAQFLTQNPEVAIRINPLSATCFPVVLKNLQANPVSVSTADMTIFDSRTCKVICQSRKAINRRLDPCKTFEFRICCEKPLPLTYICRVRVRHTNGGNEEWFFRP